jgi:ribosomal-protein-alanine N-acetyltransferase
VLSLMRMAVGPTMEWGDMIVGQHDLVTDRLLLRQPVAGDAEAIYGGYASDPEVTRYLQWSPLTGITAALRFIQGCEERRASGTEFTWAITMKSSSGVIGVVHCSPRGHKAELGYALARSYWGQGYMTEAAQAVMDWLFTSPKIHRVWATCDVENVGSVRVLEKLGMTREGTLRRWAVQPNISAEPRDSFMYARVR